MKVVKEDESARAVHTEQNIHEESKDIVYPERVMLTLGPTKDDYRAEKAFEPESTCNNLRTCSSDWNLPNHTGNYPYS